jgi:hypothetical protein
MKTGDRVKFNTGGTFDILGIVIQIDCDKGLVLVQHESGFIYVKESDLELVE